MIIIIIITKRVVNHNNLSWCLFNARPYSPTKQLSLSLSLSHPTNLQTRAVMNVLDICTVFTPTTTRVTKCCTTHLLYIPPFYEPSPANKQQRTRNVVIIELSAHTSQAFPPPCDHFHPLGISPECIQSTDILTSYTQYFFPPTVKALFFFILKVPTNQQKQKKNKATTTTTWPRVVGCCCCFQYVWNKTHNSLIFVSLCFYFLVRVYMYARMMRSSLLSMWIQSWWVWFEQVVQFCFFVIFLSMLGCINIGCWWGKCEMGKAGMGCTIVVWRGGRASLGEEWPDSRDACNNWMLKLEFTHVHGKSSYHYYQRLKR